MAQFHPVVYLHIQTTNIEYVNCILYKPHLKYYLLKSNIYSETCKTVEKKDDFGLNLFNRPINVKGSRCVVSSGPFQLIIRFTIGDNKKAVSMLIKMQ